MMRVAVAASVALGALSLVVAAALAQSTGAPSGAQPAFRGDLDLGRAADFEEYGLFAPGSVFGDVPLVAVTRRVDDPNPRRPSSMKPRRANWVNFIYASECAYDAFGIACENMAQVQVWPACERNLSVYARARQDGDVRLQLIRVRGVPAALFEDESMLEIYSGDSTIVLFAGDKSQLLELANELASVNASALGRSSFDRTEALPQPLAGAMAGNLGCSAGG